MIRGFKFIFRSRELVECRVFHAALKSPKIASTQSYAFEHPLAQLTGPKNDEVIFPAKNN